MNTKKHNFVTINRQIYLLDGLDEVHRIFTGHKITKDIVNQMISGLKEESVENMTTILFSKQGDRNIYINEAQLSDFKNLYYVYRPISHYYSKERYIKAIDDIERFKTVNFFKAMRIDFERAKMIVEIYESKQEALDESEAKIKERDGWLELVKKKWF